MIASFAVNTLGKVKAFHGPVPGVVMMMPIEKITRHLIPVSGKDSLATELLFLFLPKAI